MLVFAAYTPHTPLLLPGIGKQHLEKLLSTRGAMDHLAEELYAVRPETIVLVSGHGAHFPGAYSVNLHDHYQVNLSEFGDLTTHEEYRPDLAFIDRLQREVRRAQMPMKLFSDPVLDYGSAVPLLVLADRLPGVKIVPISYSGLPPKSHLEFGRHLKEIIQASQARIAVVASGDLSHALSADAPAGLRREGKSFDTAVREAVANVSVSKLLALDPKVVHRAAECGYRPLLILMGLMEGMNVKPEELVYESPFGVGYLVAHFHLA
jgi:aromatic ring-opening dioxygenase LigB subunit